ncbi:hypothetical protein HK105_205755 [Polyrhizophydium stewartii]|uniref:Polysaccharide lyase 14 domain-containing protein n=1 Tax=Polyrhizophydium stewartii TaxID=2732419 RepID=A0ABR4N4Z2_9FUNG
MSAVTTNKDCISKACIGWFCDAAPPPPDAPQGSTPLPAVRSWDLPSFRNLDLGDFAVAKDAYGADNRDWVRDPAGSGQYVLQVTYPAGSFHPKGTPVGGTGFYASPIDISAAKSVTFQYDVYFPADFNFVRGGKLPGLYGGRPSCTGGDAAKDCFSTRYMFRTNGAGEIYVYVDRAAQVPAFCQVPPQTFCNDVYGTSLGRGSFHWNTGAWNTITQTITLNDVGKQNGRIQVVHNNEGTAIDFDKVVFRTSDSVRCAGIDFETFFGGSTKEWATPTDQKAYFKGFKLKINF